MCKYVMCACRIDGGLCVKDGCKEEEEEQALWIVAAAGWLLGWFPWQRVKKTTVPQSCTKE